MKKVEGRTVLTGVMCFIALLLTAWFIVWMMGYGPSVAKKLADKAKVAKTAKTKVMGKAATGKKWLPKKVRIEPEEPMGRHKMSPYPPPAPEVKPLPPRVDQPKLIQPPERKVHHGYVQYPDPSPEGGGWQEVGGQFIRPNPHDGPHDLVMEKPLQSEVIWGESQDGTVSAANVYGRMGSCPPGFKELKPERVRGRKNHE